MLQSVAVCCSVLQCVAVCCSHVWHAGQYHLCCSVLQCVALCCSVLQCVAVCCSVLQCVAVMYNMQVTTICVFVSLCLRVFASLCPCVCASLCLPISASLRVGVRVWTPIFSLSLSLTHTLTSIQDTLSGWVWVYFVALIILGPWLALNLFLVVISTQYDENSNLLREEEERRLEEEDAAEHVRRAQIEEVAACIDSCMYIYK